MSDKPVPKNLSRRYSPTPPQVLVLGFLALIVVGALLLMLPVMSADGRPVKAVDALFTATSAVCVTGLAVLDTGLSFSRTGQTLIMILIQIGGLGFMAMSTFIFIFLGKRIGLRERLLIRESLGQLSLQGVVRLVRYVLLLTLSVEAAGALLFFLRFAPRFGAREGLYMAVFHSVSAFCNAGFDILGPHTGRFSSLTAFVGDPVVNLATVGLIVTGGIGFVVIADLYSYGRRRSRRLALHTRVVLTATLLLIVGGTAAVLLLEWNNPATLGALSPVQRILAAFFQAVTPRTAGFNTLDIGSMNGATQLLLVILMFIGASPGGTGGGIKTTTFSILVISVVALLRGRQESNIYERHIPTDLLLRALAVTMLSLALILTAVMAMEIVERVGLQPVLFEVVSAFGTVGLSTGITPGLTAFSKLLLALVMFCGRVGPLTLAVALTQRQSKAVVAYPDERIPIG